MRRVAVSAIDAVRKYKRLIVPAVEVLIFTAILFLSYWIRLGSDSLDYVRQVIFLAVSVVPVKILLFWMFKLYHISFRYTSVYEALVVSKASLLCALYFSFVALIFRDLPVMTGFPRSVIFIDFMLSFLLSSAIRLSVRLLYFPHSRAKRGRKVLIVGAGSAGEQLVKEIFASRNTNYEPVAFIDDDPNKQGSIIHGVKVVGTKKDIPKVVSRLSPDEIIIAIPSATSTQLKSIMEYVRKSGVYNVKILPGLSSIISGKVAISDIREIVVEDLLGRQPIEIDAKLVASYFKGRRVLVTGAAGSIGSELCRQIALFEPSLLIMVDIGETELFFIDMEMKKKFPGTSVAKIRDVKDEIGMRQIFSCYFPEIVFHAAAYKHVPLGEENPREVILNNIEGTRIAANLSKEFGVQKFIFISTDKAVNPVSVMGATKKIAENLIRCLTDERCKFIAVRFGNVLESRGSVVPLFKEYLKRGEAIKVTHPDMERYLMSISEAVSLVIQAAALGNGGEIFVLDMGKPVKIIDLAKEMIRLHGLEPDIDIPIVITGKRPGEKLSEELMTFEEQRIAVKKGKFFIISNKKTDDGYVRKVEELINLAKIDTNERKLIELLSELVPDYQPGQIL